MAGKLAKRLADAVFAAIKSQCLSPFRKGFYAFTEGTSGAEGVFREDGFAPFSYMTWDRAPASSGRCGSGLSFATELLVIVR